MARIADCLVKAVRPGVSGFDLQTIGNKAFIKLDDDRRVEFSLDTMGYSGNYELLLMKLISKTHGELERTGLKFKDLLGVGKMVTDGWDDGYRWRGVSPRDMLMIAQSIRDYIDLWR